MGENDQVMVGGMNEKHACSLGPRKTTERLDRFVL